MQKFILFVKGLMLGVTAIIPGVSLGTMALVMDVYSNSIHSIKIIISPHTWKKNKSILLSSFLFIGILSLGILIAIMLSATIIETLFKNNKIFLLFTFAGIILGSLPIIFKKYILPYYKIKHVGKFLLYTCIGALIIIFFSSHGSKEITDTVVTLNIAEIMRALLFGIITSVAGILPGISGSYISLTLGYYPTFLFIFSNAIIGLMLPFLIGSFIGLVLIAIFLDFILQKFPAVSYAIIYGIILSSLIYIIPWKDMNHFTITQWLIVIGCILLGIAISSLGFFLNKITTSKK